MFLRTLRSLSAAFLGQLAAAATTSKTELSQTPGACAGAEKPTRLLCHDTGSEPLSCSIFEGPNLGTETKI